MLRAQGIRQHLPATRAWWGRHRVVRAKRRAV